MVTVAIPAGDMQQAHEDCHRALKLDPNNKQLLSLCGELMGPGGAKCDQDVQQRARARFASGQYSAAADAFSLLVLLHKNDSVKRAAALSNRAMCLLCMHQFDKALEACQAAFTCATELASLPQGPAEAALEFLKDVLCAPEAAAVVMKCVGRMATCIAHMKDFSEAHRLYTIAAHIARERGDCDTAQAFVADAQKMISLPHEAVPGG